jgi:Zn-dependent protease with chaperone function
MRPAHIDILDVQQSVAYRSEENIKFSNWMKTGIILMAGITALLGLALSALAGPARVLLILAIGAATNFFAYWFSDKMVLRMYNAQELAAMNGGRPRRTPRLRR